LLKVVSSTITLTLNLIFGRYMFKYKEINENSVLDFNRIIFHKCCLSKKKAWSGWYPHVKTHVQLLCCRDHIFFNFKNIYIYNYIGGGNRSTWRKPPTCHKSLTNFIT
jgi:hypothetical protein